MKYFCYDPEIGFELYCTAEKAQTAAADSITNYRDESSDGWHGGVGNVCWGEVKEVATEGYRSPDNSGVNDYLCDYELAPVETAAEKPKKTDEELLEAMAVAHWEVAYSGCNRWGLLRNARKHELLKQMRAALAVVREEMK